MPEHAGPYVGLPTREEQGSDARAESGGEAFEPPAVTLPKGGGAIRGIGEKFAANPVTGTGSLTIPVACSAGRSGFGPELTLSYDSGAGNGEFGFGWSLSAPSIARKTDKGLPRYDDSDVFVMSGAEDLVPMLVEQNGKWKPHTSTRTFADGSKWRVERYRPRVEGNLTRIERWTNSKSGGVHWRSISRTNVTTVYGETIESRIYDPSDERRVFTWLICSTYDDRGNAILYRWEHEDDAGVDIGLANERNRTRSANRHLKRILYGNKTPRATNEDLTQRTDWLFEVVLDYGEHDDDAPTPRQSGKWTCRRDPFSSYRSGFEVRSYRLCRRVLMFHHFSGEPGVGKDCLVGATELAYREGPVASFLVSVTSRGYRRTTGGGYVTKAMPPLELEYSAPEIGSDVHELDPASAENLPAGLGGALQRWVDLDGEGLSGVLVEQGGAWRYKRNLGRAPGDGSGDGARFGPLEQVASAPSISDLRPQLLDLEGDGQIDLVQVAPPLSGFHERGHDGTWSSFVPFDSMPNLPWGDPNLRFVDLTGDGRADVLITEDAAVRWHHSLGEEGYGAEERVARALDEEAGPRVLIADGTESVHLADMSGDGLPDLVRIRGGEVSYWPNLGYGRFGAKVTMDGSPNFDPPDLFDPRRIRLADTDGTGATDLIYLAPDGARLYFNEAGNSWSAPLSIDGFAADDVSEISVLDLLGNGTACLVSSSPLERDARRPMRYVELMAAGKPHLLTGIRNNLGGETRVTYAPSTRFYVADLEAGHPWHTRLPFPVHVVERIDSVDRIGGGRFVTRYAYHHGYFDGAEREFRGFGCVEQWDTDELDALREAGPAPNVDEASYVPPVRTKTWFHLGARVDGGRVTRQFEQDYWDDQGAAGGSPLPDTQLPTTVRLPNDNRLPVLLSPEEELEACRALKGSILRQETYADDGSAAAGRPYLVSEHNYTIELRQPRGGNPHAVFHVHKREAVDAHYERKLYDVGGQMRLDPRVKHAATLAVDPFGNVERTVEVSYGRRFDDPDPLLHEDDRKVQRRAITTCAINSFTDLVDEDDAYRTPLPSEQRTYELLKVIPPLRAGGGTRRFTFSELDAKLTEAGDGSGDLPYEDIEGAGATGSRAYRRLIECLRFLYRRDDLTGPLNPGELQPLALPFRTYRLAFTPGLLSSVFKRPRPQGGAPEDLIADPAAMLGDECGYVLSDDLKASGELPASEPDGHWWLSSGRVFYSPAPAAAAVELAEAEDHFFLGRRFEDAFGSTTKITWDDYDLLALESEDAAGNRARAGERKHSGTVTNGNDYRVLKPRVVSDANRNRSAVSFDALGMVAGSARMGKPEESLGDSVAGFDPDPPDAAAAAAFQSPLANGPALLGRASTRVLYDMSAYLRTRDDPQPAPPAVYTLSRQTHDADLTAGAVSPVRHMFSYSDGLGREVQQKHQAEPDPVAGGGPRWVGTGWTVFDNKGQPVRHYEPFFTATHRYERDTGVGASSTLLYDPVGRIVATLHPDHTYEKVVFDAWRQVTWDASDTVTADPALDADVGPMLRRIRQTDRLPTWYAARSGGGRGADEQAAAEKAAEHAGTPAVTQMDPLGRGFAAFSHNRFKRASATVDEHYANRVLFDVEGNRRRVLDPGGSDPRGRLVLGSDYDMLGHPIREASMDAGVHWTLSDVLAQPVYAWDGRGHSAHTTYDALRRPLETRVRAGSGAERTVTRTTYGESVTNPEAANMRSRTAEVRDGAGLQVSVAFDFKGNLVESSRQLAKQYDGQLDWSVVVPLEQEVFTATTTYDALDRPLELTAPDSTVVHVGYNEAGLLDSLTANLKGAVAATRFVSDITYDARGQRRSIAYGNGARTDYEQDPQTFRLTRLTTKRGAGFPGDAPGGVQQIAYTYDPLGNVTHVEDGAQQTLFFRNHRVEPDSDYTYDALCRLIEATGREHLGQAGASPAPPSPAGGTQVPHPGDGLAMGRYRERYSYDETGNLLEISHTSEDAATGGWTRTYEYDEQSLLEAGEKSNRLTRAETGAGGQPDITYDESGNVTRMPHLALMDWDNRNQLVAVASQVVAAGTPETTHYAYDAGGQRVRKVVARQAAVGQHPTRAAERIYVGAFELYREYGADGTSITLERETLHVMDDRRRIALVETRTLGNDGSPQRQIRYELGNLIDSATLELDDQARIVSYEEYHPYGSSSYQAVASATDAPKRYRYAGKERDSETGFQNGGRRYYAPWLGRWISCDPKGLVDGPNLYAYVGCNPISRVDAAGSEQTDAKLMWEYAKSLVTDPKELYSYTPMGWSLTDWKNSGLALAGYAKGVGEVVAAPGVLTYYATGSLLYRTDPQFYSHYKEQDAKFQEIASGLKKATASPGAAVDFVVEGFTGGLDRMNKALQKGDPFEAGAGAGNFTASLAMAAEGGKGGKFSVSWEPSTQTVATMGLNLALTAPPNALPALATLTANSANQAAYKKSSGGGGFGGAPIVSGKAATKVAKLSAAARAELALIKEKVIDLAAWGIGIADAEGIPRTFGRAGTNAHATLEAFVADLNAELAKKGSKFRLIAEQFYDAKGNVTGRRAAGSVGVDIRVEYQGKLTDVAWDLKTGRIGAMLDEIGKLIDAVVEPLGPRAPNPPVPPVTVP